MTVLPRKGDNVLNVLQISVSLFSGRVEGKKRKGSEKGFRKMLIGE